MQFLTRRNVNRVFMKKILLIEDDGGVSNLIQRGLSEGGYRVDAVSDGMQGWEAVFASSYDLIILDIIMPGIDGLEFCRCFRRQFGTATPILMLTALVLAEDVARGLEAGADDYLRKPFRWVELEARVANLLRRHSKTDTAADTCTISDLTLDRQRHQVVRGGKAIMLSTTEYALLDCLMSHRGQPLSRSILLREVWHRDFDTYTNLVDVYINYLRNKIDRGHERKLIRTVVGKGYAIDDNDG